MKQSVQAFPKVLPRERIQSPKPKRRFSWLWFFIGVIAIGWLYWFIFHSSYFAVQTVEVVGTDAPALHDLANSVKGMNIFSINSTTLESSFSQAYPPLATLDLVRGLPNAVRLIVTLRKPVLRWQVTNTTYILDAYGQIFDEGDKSDYASLPKIDDKSGISLHMGEQVASPDFITFIQNVDSQAPKLFNHAVTANEVTDTTLLVDLVFDNGLRVRLAIERPWQEQLTSAATIFSNHPDAKVIDVRVPGWGYWK